MTLIDRLMEKTRKSNKEGGTASSSQPPAQGYASTHSPASASGSSYQHQYAGYTAYGRQQHNTGAVRAHSLQAGIRPTEAVAGTGKPPLSISLPYSSQPPQPQSPGLNGTKGLHYENALRQVGLHKQMLQAHYQGT